MLYLHLPDAETRLREVRKLAQGHPGFWAPSTRAYTAAELGCLSSISRKGWILLLVRTFPWMCYKACSQTFLKGTITLP